MKKDAMATAAAAAVTVVATAASASLSGKKHAANKNATGLEGDTASKMQNVTRILINATNPKQTNGNYHVHMPVERALQ